MLAGRVVLFTILAGIVWLAAMVGLIALYTTVNPPVSTLMLIRSVEGQPIKQSWVPLEEISPHLVRAVIASEDSRFCRHYGIDPVEIRNAIDRARDGLPRGASTMTMQLAKNLFLWPHQSYVRKALEVPLTLTMELFWSKRRIAEVYLNVVEWGPGIYGAEAAARHHFRKAAAALGPAEAARLAVSLPNPLVRSAGQPSRLVLKLAGGIERRVRGGGGNARCVLG